MSGTGKWIDPNSDKRDKDVGIENKKGPAAGQYGQNAGSGQSAGGPYPNPHTRKGGGEGGTARKDFAGQTNQGYHGGGQLGDRNYSDRDHNAASKQGGPGHGKEKAD